MSYYSAKKIVKESLGIEIITVTLGILGGGFLSMGIETFLALPILLAFVPIINGVGGNLLSIFGTRLTSSLHAGFTRSSKKDFFAFAAVGLAALAVVALTIYVTSSLIYGEFTSVRMLLILILSGGLQVCFLLPVTAAVAIIAFRMGADPDNIVIPMMTALSDVAGILFLLLSVRLVGL